MTKICAYCGKDLSRWPLDPGRIIKCDTCTRQAVPSPEMPLKQPERPPKSQTPLPKYLRVGQVLKIK